MARKTPIDSESKYRSHYGSGGEYTRSLVHGFAQRQVQKMGAKRRTKRLTGHAKVAQAKARGNA